MNHISHSLSDLLHSVWHSLGPSVSLWMALFLFNGWVIFQCLYVPHLLYPFLCQRTSRLLPCLGCCKQCCSEHPGAPTVQLSHSVMCSSWRPHGLQHARPPCPSPTPKACSKSCLLSWWCHPTISSSDEPFSSCLQPFPTSGSFPVSRLLPSGGQSIGASASASILPMNIQALFPLGLTALISLQSERLSRVFSNTAIQKHQFFGAQLSLLSNSHIHTWLLEKT